MTGTNRLPTSTATPIRLCVYQATRRPKQSVRILQTAFGILNIDGRLGQAHADLMDCVMFCADQHRIQEGRLEVIVDPYRIRKAMGGGKQYSAEQLTTLERDFLHTILTVETPKIKITGHIVEKIVEAKLTKSDPRCWAEGKRNLQVWVFSTEWTRLVQNDIARYYNPMPLCRIDHGSVAAIARHVLTHQYQPNGGWHLEGLIKAAGVERQASKVRQEMQESSDTLAELGICIDGDRLILAAPARPIAAPARKNPVLAAPARELGVSSGSSGFFRKPEELKTERRESGTQGADRY